MENEFKLASTNKRQLDLGLVVYKYKIIENAFSRTSRYNFCPGVEP
jgi:hypothetical protein